MHESQTTYSRSGKVVLANIGMCDGCGQKKSIVTVSSWGNYCSACSEDLWQQWQKRGQVDWDSRAAVMRNPDTGEPFRLQDDGT